MKRMNFPNRKDKRRAEAAARQEARDKRGDKRQLEKLIASGYPGCKEAKRLRRRLK